MLAPAGPVFAADQSLSGCWQSLHVEERLASGHINHIHNNCVMAFTARDVRTDCQFPKGGHYTSVARLKQDKAGQVTLTLLSSNSIAKQTLAPKTLEYLVEGDYLVMRESHLALAGTNDSTALETTRTLLRMPGFAARTAGAPLACSALGP